MCEVFALLWLGNLACEITSLMEELEKTSLTFGLVSCIRMGFSSIYVINVLIEILEWI